MKHSGMNQREALRLAKELGLVITHPRGAGELLIIHATLGRIRINGRRKDAPRCLTTLLNQARALSQQDT